MKATQNQVIPLHPYTEDQALAWLHQKGEVVISGAALGRQFGWSKQKASRRLHAWSATGRIKRRGKLIVSLRHDTDPQTSQGGKTPPETSKKKVRSNVPRILFAILLFLLGVSIASILISVNVISWGRFGQSQEWYISSGFVALGVTIPVAVVSLPAVARWADRGTAATLWTLWLFLFLVDLLVAVGFAHGNFGNAVAATEATVNRRAFLERRVHSLLSERQRMGDFPYTTPEAAQAASTSKQRACSTGTYCARESAKEETVLRHRGATIRAEEIKAELQKAEGELASIRVVATSDSMTDGIVDLVYQLGYKLESGHVRTARNVVFALFLLVPAGFFRGAASLIRR